MNENEKKVALHLNNKLSSDKINFILDGIKNNDLKCEIIATLPLKSPTIALILSLLFGGIGVDRFYIGDYSIGICKLFVSFISWFLLLGWVWWLIDLFLIYGATENKNYETLLPFII